VLVLKVHALAGSALNMHDAVANAMRMADSVLREAITLATINAARAGRIAGRNVRSHTGERADFRPLRKNEAA